LASGFFWLLFAVTGKQLLRMFGLQRKLTEGTSVFTGMTFWIAVGLLAYAITPR
jgi:FtsH-binding integral membrane protein